MRDLVFAHVLWAFDYPACSGELFRLAGRHLDLRRRLGQWGPTAEPRYARRIALDTSNPSSVMIGLKLTSIGNSLPSACCPCKV